MSEDSKNKKNSFWQFISVIFIIIAFIIWALIFISEQSSGKLFSISGDYFVTEERRPNNSDDDCEYFIYSEAENIEIASGTHDCGSLRWRATLDPSNDEKIDVLVMDGSGYIGFVYPTTPNGSVFASLYHYLTIISHLSAND